MSECDELLQRAWEGEITGRAFFATLARRLPEDAAMWELMATIEEVTAGVIAPVAEAHGITIDETGSAATGERFGDSAAAASRDDILTGGLEVIAQYLVIYEQLCELLPPGEAWLGRELVDHERALEALVQGALGRRADGAAAATTDYLARHGVIATAP